MGTYLGLTGPLQFFWARCCPITRKNSFVFVFVGFCVCSSLLLCLLNAVRRRVVAAQRVARGAVHVGEDLVVISLEVALALPSPLGDLGLLILLVIRCRGRRRRCGSGLGLVLATLGAATALGSSGSRGVGLRVRLSRACAGGLQSGGLRLPVRLIILSGRSGLALIALVEHLLEAELDARRGGRHLLADLLLEEVPAAGAARATRALARLLRTGHRSRRGRRGHGGASQDSLHEGHLLRLESQELRDHVLGNGERCHGGCVWECSSQCVFACLSGPMGVGPAGLQFFFQIEGTCRGKTPTRKWARWAV